MVITRLMLLGLMLLGGPLLAQTWQQETASAAWSPRKGHGMETYNNKLWIIGGWAYPGNSEVWSSTDGQNWQMETASAPWGALENHATAVFDGKLWVLGGNETSGPTFKQDAWYSTDGINWTQTTPPWPARQFHAAAVFDNKLWVLGGKGNSGNLDDVWYTSDGIGWTQVTTTSPMWTPRVGHAATAYDNKLWVVGGGSGGKQKDIWHTTDGANWTEVMPSGPMWEERNLHQLVEFNGRLVVLGGRTPTGFADDMWSTTDGVTWYQDFLATGWSARSMLDSAVYNGKLWVAGGTDGVGYPQDMYNDVWSLDDGSLKVATHNPLPSGAEGHSYTANIQAIYGTTPYIWNTNVLGLPSGLTATQPANSDELEISGTPDIGSAGVYTITVSVDDSDSPPSSATKQFDLVIYDPAPLPLEDSFSTDKGWILGAGWQRDPAVAYTPQDLPNREEPGQDTTPNNSDDMILGHEIGADYTNNMMETYAVSPAFDCSGAATVQLRFMRWIGVSINDHARVQVTSDGTNWTDVWTSNGSTVQTSGQWEAVAYDITSVAANEPVVQVRFVLGPTDGSIVNVGWCIDDFEILEPGPALVVTEGPSPGTGITDDEPVGGLRDFGNVNVGQNSQVLEITFTNNSITPITSAGGYVKSGANPDKFIVITAPAGLIPVGGSTTMEIQFNSNAGSPGGAGTYTAIISYDHNASGPGVGTAPFDINVRAEAVPSAPDIHVAEQGGPGIPHDDPATGGRDFGSVSVGNASSPLTIEITNNGSVDLSISAIQMDGGYGDWSSFDVDTSGLSFSPYVVIGPQQSESFEVEFTPASAGQKDARILIVHNDSNHASYPGGYRVPVTGFGLASGPALSVAAGSGSLSHDEAASGGRDFGDVTVNTTSSPLVITIENPGTADLTVQNFTLGGPDSAHFNLDTASFSSPVANGSSDTFEVEFTPTSSGQKDAWVEFDHNDSARTSPFRVNFTGNGTTNAPTASVRIGNASGPQLPNPAPANGALDFGQRDVGGSLGSAVIIYVENTGNAPLVLHAPTINSSEFQLQNASGFAQTLAVNDDASFDIVFDPASVGMHTAVIEFDHNDTATGSPFVINVEGEGVLNSPLIEVREGGPGGPSVASGAPAFPGGGRDCGAISVGGSGTGVIALAIVNAGIQDLDLSSISLGGPNAGDFTVDTAGMTNPVPPGSDTTFQVLFHPSLGGIKDAEVRIDHNDPTRPFPFLVPVRGTGVDPGGVQIATASLPAGTVGSSYPATQMNAVQGAPPYTWSIYSGGPPPGMNLSAGGLLDGMPTSAGSFDVRVRVEDNSGATHERSFTIRIDSAPASSGNSGSSGGSGCVGNDSTGWPAMAATFGLLALAFAARRRRSGV